jgi:THO complex subunit 2
MRERRANTQALYTQRKFNLCREESEGYAKLLSVLHQSESGIAAGAEQAEAAVEQVRSLIGAFLCLL